MRRILLILLVATAFSCSKKHADVVVQPPTDPVLNYVQFISNSPRTTIPNSTWGQATFSINVKNSKDLKLIAMYQNNGTYIENLDPVDKLQIFTVYIVPLHPDSISYFFKLTLQDNSISTGGKFTANF